MNSEDAKSAGLTYTGYTLYKHKQAKFYVFDFTLNSQDGLVYGRQYMTVINGKMYNITLHSYSGQLTQQSRDMQKSVVDNTTFTVVKKKPGSFDWGSVAGSALRGALIGGGVGLVAFLARKFLKRKA